MPAQTPYQALSDFVGSQPAKRSLVDFCVRPDDSKSVLYANPDPNDAAFGRFSAGVRAKWADQRIPSVEWDLLEGAIADLRDRFSGTSTNALFPPPKGKEPPSSSILGGTGMSVSMLFLNYREVAECEPISAGAEDAAARPNSWKQLRAVLGDLYAQYAILESDKQRAKDRWSNKQWEKFSPFDRNRYFVKTSNAVERLIAGTSNANKLTELPLVSPRTDAGAHPFNPRMPDRHSGSDADWREAILRDDFYACSQGTAVLQVRDAGGHSSVSRPVQWRWYYPGGSTKDAVSGAGRVGLIGRGRRMTVRQGERLVMKSKWFAAGALMAQWIAEDLTRTQLDKVDDFTQRFLHALRMKPDYSFANFRDLVNRLEVARDNLVSVSSTNAEGVYHPWTTNRVIQDYLAPLFTAVLYACAYGAADVRLMCISQETAAGTAYQNGGDTFTLPALDELFPALLVGVPGPGGGFSAYHDLVPLKEGLRVKIGTCPEVSYADEALTGASPNVVSGAITDTSKVTLPQHSEVSKCALVVEMVNGCIYVRVTNLNGASIRKGPNGTWEDMMSGDSDDSGNLFSIGDAIMLKPASAGIKVEIVARLQSETERDARARRRTGGRGARAKDKPRR